MLALNFCALKPSIMTLVAPPVTGIDATSSTAAEAVEPCSTDVSDEIGWNNEGKSAGLAGIDVLAGPSCAGDISTGRTCLSF
jgi:hypothetical protein